MAHSYTAIKQYQQCPKQYYEVRVLKKWPTKQSPEMIYGDAVHSALENAARYDEVLPVRFAHLQPYVDGIKAAIAAGWQAIPENTIGVTYDGKGVLGRKDIWWAKDVKIAGKADITLIRPDGLFARIGDYKTGSDKYPDMEQLDLMAYFTFVEYPAIQDIEAMLIYTKVGTTYPYQPARYNRETDMPVIAERWDGYIAAVENAKASNHWPDNGGNPLCGWCAVVSCPFHEEFVGIRLKKERKRG